MSDVAGDGNYCPCCGEPHPHYRDGMCELCWNEQNQMWHRSNDIVERLLERAKRCAEIQLVEAHPEIMVEAAADIRRLRAVVVRAKDALLDGQSTQWVHDLLVSALEDKP